MLFECELSNMRHHLFPRTQLVISFAGAGDASICSFQSFHEMLLVTIFLVLRHRSCFVATGKDAIQDTIVFNIECRKTRLSLGNPRLSAYHKRCVVVETGAVMYWSVSSKSTSPCFTHLKVLGQIITSSCTTTLGTQN
jgi:hypothetical protein